MMNTPELFEIGTGKQKISDEWNGKTEWITGEYVVQFDDQFHRYKFRNISNEEMRLAP